MNVQRDGDNGLRIPGVITLYRQGKGGYLHVDGVPFPYPLAPGFGMRINTEDPPTALPSVTLGLVAYRVEVVNEVAGNPHGLHGRPDPIMRDVHLADRDPADPDPWSPPGYTDLINRIRTREATPA